MSTHDEKRGRLAGVLQELAREAFSLPDDEGTAAGAREMAELLIRVGGLPVDEATRPDTPPTATKTSSQSR